MRDVLPVAAALIRDGASFALATVVSSDGSSPRELGASMIVDASGHTFGNVSDGCVDGVVYERCLDAAHTGEVTVERYGIPADDLVDIGLACGGIIDVLVQFVTPGSSTAKTLALLAERDASAVPTTARLRRHGPHAGSLRIDDSALPEAAADPTGADLELRFGSAPRLIIVGAVQAAVSLAALGGVLGWSVTVVDPRGVFLTPERFPGAEVVVAHPDRYFADALAAGLLDETTAVCVLSHDAKIDAPALRWALGSRAGYVGAMGSRQTHNDRVQRLRTAGVDDASIARLRSPIGLDLGGVTPAETALSIVAEIVADLHGASGSRLSSLFGPVHARTHDASIAASHGVGCAPVR